MNDAKSALAALARRAVACKGWRWMPGMLAVEWAAPGMSLTGGRPVRVDERWHEVGVWLPDLSDPATLGCLLALVREAWEGPLLGVAFDYAVGEWAVRLWNGSDLREGFGATEAEALVAALEAAPLTQQTRPVTLTAVRAHGRLAP